MSTSPLNSKECKGLKVVRKVCISKVIHAGLWFDSNEKKSAKILLENYLSSNITYEHAYSAAGNNRAIREALFHAHRIVDAVNNPITSHSPKGKLPRRWTDYEDLRLIGGVLIYGEDSFREISEFVGCDRNRAQCIQRWSRTLNPDIKKNGWTSEEDSALIEIVKEVTPLSWTQVAKMLGDRTDVQCRYRYQQLMKRSKGAVQKKCHNVIPSVQEFNYLYKPYSIDEFLSCFS